MEGLDVLTQRMESRILGMSDVISLVERAHVNLMKKRQEKLRKIAKTHSDLMIF